MTPGRSVDARRCGLVHTRSRLPIAMAPMPLILSHGPQGRESKDAEWCSCGRPASFDSAASRPAQGEAIGGGSPVEKRHRWHISVSLPHPFIPPLVSPPTTRSWNTAIRIDTGTMATISAAEMIGQGKANSPW